MVFGFSFIFMKIKKPICRSLLFLIYTFILLLGSPNSVQAQKQASITVMPASLDAKIKGGSSYTQNFTLVNSTDMRLRFNCSVGDFWYNSENKRVNGRPGTLPRSASPWVQFSPAEIVIEPNSSAVIKAVVTVPQGVSGSYFTMPIFEASPADKPNLIEPTAKIENTATAAIGIRFRGLMMFTTEGTSEYNVEIMGGRILPPTASSELEMQLDLRNRGTAHANLRGAFAILNSSGALVGRGKTEEKRYLPGQRNVLRGAWAGELPPGNYTCVITLSYNRVGLEPVTLVYELPLSVK
jgi:hypothetical protein